MRKCTYFICIHVSLETTCMWNMLSSCIKPILCLNSVSLLSWKYFSALCSLSFVSDMDHGCRASSWDPGQAASPFCACEVIPLLYTSFHLSWLLTSSLCGCQSPLELHNAWCYLRDRKVLPYHIVVEHAVERDITDSLLLILLSYSKFTAVGLNLCVQCLIPQLGNLPIKLRLYATVEEN